MTVILYDGECGFCSASVQFVLTRDREGVFRYASIQSNAGRALLREHGIDDPQLDTMFLLEDGTVYQRSTAGLRIARRLPRYRLLAGLALLVPRPLRDWVYDLVARNRHRLGGGENCLLPTEEQRARFLDRGE